MKYLVSFLESLLVIAVALFWIADVLNFPFMKFFDTECPINTLAWLLIWIMFILVRVADEDKENR